MATIMNPHTGMPVDFAAIDPNDPLSYQRLLQMAGLGGATQMSPQGGERMRGNSAAEQAMRMIEQGLYDPSALDGYTAGQGRQGYDLTQYLRDPTGNLVAQETYYDRESMNSQDYLDAALKSAAVVASVYGAGTGLEAMGFGAGAGSGTATLGATGPMATPVATSSALPSLGAMGMPTAASLGIGELAVIGSGLVGGIGTMGTIAPSAATTASSSLPMLGPAPEVTAGSIGAMLPSLSQWSGGGSGLPRMPSLGSIAAPVLGAIAGGVDAAQGSADTQTQQSRLDPNMQRLLYGDNGQGGLLNQANAFFQANRGINPTAQQGLDMSKAFYTDPSYAQGYGQLRSQGLGLLGQPIAGNPFARKGG